MTRDELTQLAKEVGAETTDFLENDEVIVFEKDQLERFATLVSAPLEEEIRRLRFCILEGDAAAAMEYLAYCVEKDVAKEQERCIEIVERQLEAALGYVAVPLGNKITAAIRAKGEGK